MFSQNKCQHSHRKNVNQFTWITVFNFKNICAYCHLRQMLDSIMHLVKKSAKKLRKFVRTAYQEPENSDSLCTINKYFAIHFLIIFKISLNSVWHEQKKQKTNSITNRNIKRLVVNVKQLSLIYQTNYNFNHWFFFKLKLESEV